MAENWEIEVFYDGGCPLCMREISMLRRWDKAGRIRFTDIDAPTFRAADYGKTYDEFMSQIYGRLPDGNFLTGVEVFRRLYAVVGFRTLTAITRWPLISQTLDLGYRVFAKNRLRLTGRCQTGSCRIDTVQ